MPRHGSPPSWRRRPGPTAHLLSEPAAQRDRSSRAANEGAETDWEAVSVVFVGAIAHYWLLRDVFGSHPSGVDEDRYVAAVARTAATSLLR